MSARRLAGLAALLVPLACAVDVAYGADATGEVVVLLRALDVDGDARSYDQQLNLDDGLRLAEARLDWRGAARGPVDRLSFTTLGVGGEPFSSTSARIGRRGAWEIDWRRRESEYRRDARALGDVRSLDFEREHDVATLEVEAGSRTTIRAAFDRYERRGDTTFLLDLSREEFELEAPVDETREQFLVAVDHRFARGSVTFTERWLDLDSDERARLAAPSEGSNPRGATRLDAFTLRRPAALDGRDHQLALRLEPTERLRLGIDALFGRADVDARILEEADGVDFTGAPLPARSDGDASAERDHRRVELTGAFAVSQTLTLTASVRDARLDQQGTSAFESAGSTRLDHDVQRATVGAAWTPAARVDVDVRLRRDRRRVAQRADGVGRRTETTDGEGGRMRLRWRPREGLALSLRVDADRLDDPWTLASPTDRRAVRLRASRAWANGVRIEFGHDRERRDNDATGWSATVRRSHGRIEHGGESGSVSLGVTRLDLERETDLIVVGGSLSTPLAIDFDSDSTLLDLLAHRRLTDALDLSLALRRHDAEGSTPVERNEVRVGLRGRLTPRIRWGLDGRWVEFDVGGSAAGPAGAFDVRIVEASLGIGL